MLYYRQYITFPSVICHNAPELGQNRADADRIGPVLAKFWYIGAWFQGICYMAIGGIEGLNVFNHTGHLVMLQVTANVEKNAIYDHW